MADLPEGHITREVYEASRKLIKEAEIALKRGWLIAAICDIFGHNDRHGAIEAFQHCIELSLKSMWTIVGFKYPKDHNPTKKFEKVEQRFFKLLPYTKEDPNFPKFSDWVRSKGRAMKALHEQTIYGDEEKGKSASELFDYNEMMQWADDAILIHQIVFGEIKTIGWKNKLLTPDEIKEMEQIYDSVQKWKNIPALADALDNYLDRRFKAS